MSEKNIANDNLSLSKQRKIQRKKDIEKAKRGKVVGRIIAGAILTVLAAAVCLVGFILIRNAVTHVKMNNDSSKLLDNRGFIEGIKATDYVTLPDYKNVSVPYSSIELKDEDLQKKIDALVAAKAAQSETTDKAVAKDDVIYVIYKAYFEDGTEVESGSTEEAGKQITVGSSSMKDYGFDDALVGKKIADEAFDIEVTYPADYTDTKVAGKKIRYNTKIKSIKITPEFNDDFVKEYYKDDAETAEGYKTFLKEQTERASLVEYVSKAFVEGAQVNGYPKEYLKHLKGLVKYADYENFVYYNNFYLQYMGQAAFATFEDYIKQTYKMTEAKYDRTKLVENTKVQLAQMLYYQAIAETENITATLADYKAHVLKEGTTEENFESTVKYYGEPALVRQYLVEKVNDYLADVAKVVKD